MDIKKIIDYVCLGFIGILILYLLYLYKEKLLMDVEFWKSMALNQSNVSLCYDELGKMVYKPIENETINILNESIFKIQ